MRKIDLMIVGAQKAGTTALKNYLNEHPEIAGHPQTEFAYFKDDELFAQDYETVFKKHFTTGNYKTAKKIVAKNVALYYSDKALERLSIHNPDCKIVFILREPVSRAYSSYQMEKFMGGMNGREFSELIQISASGDENDPMYRLLIYLSLYVQHLKIIYKYFPKENVLIIDYDKFKNDSLKYCKVIFSILNVDSGFNPDTSKKYNITGKAKSDFLKTIIKTLRSKNNPIKVVAKKILPYSIFTKASTKLIEMNKSGNNKAALDETVKLKLQEYFKPFNNELSELSGMDFSEWNR